MKKVIHALSLLVFCLPIVSCQKIESRDVGVRFWKVPTFVGGGLSKNVYRSGEVAVEYPVISDLYQIDIGLRDLAFSSENGNVLETRALDGNEVTLEVTVTYQISQESEKLLRLVEEIGRTDEEIEAVVRSVARADIRSYMNELRTSQFIDSTSSYGALKKVQSKLNERLGPFGLEFKQLKLDRYYFDDEYEGLLKQIQKFEEDVKRERERRVVVERDIETSKERAQGVKLALLREAEGYRDRRVRDGENYLKEKTNEAQAIRATAEAEAAALKKQIEALSGPGGDALVKLEFAKQLLANEPTFVVLNSAKGSGDLNVNRIDTNRLLEQAKVFEALREEKSSSSSNDIVEERPFGLEKTEQ